MHAERIQKVLARAGLGSRRQIEHYIRVGRIKVNGHLAQLGDSLTCQDRVTLDGVSISSDQWAVLPTRVLLYHKPVRKLCTRYDQNNRPIIFQSFPQLQQGRWISIGRLDYNTSGLLLITNNGLLAHQLMHPGGQIEREYAVRLSGRITPTIFARLQKGVWLEEGLARFEWIRCSSRGCGGHHQWAHVMVREGRKRLVRRLWQSQHLQVNRLIRIRFGYLCLPPQLLPDHYWELTEIAVRQLVFSIGASNAMLAVQSIDPDVLYLKNP